jgi:hypothetical protein
MYRFELISAVNPLFKHHLSDLDASWLYRVWKQEKTCLRAMFRQKD